MGGKTPGQIEAESAALLQELGLTEYEAYTFLHLIRLGTATARDIADLKEVPRTRVYDSVDSLHEAGLVDIQYTTPRKFTAVSMESALRKLELRQENTIRALSELLEELEPVEKRLEEFGVWTVSNREAIATRVVEFLEDADEEIIYMTNDDLLTEPHLEALQAADDRGVDIYMAQVSQRVGERIRERVPTAELFETLWEWSAAGAGSLLITDEETALVSVCVTDRDTTGPDEVAIWGSGPNNSLVVVLRAIFTWRLASQNFVVDSDAKSDR